jgi:hypothetical protein
MTTFKGFIVGFLIFGLVSCIDKDNAILNGKDFDKGKWFLVWEDYAKGTLCIIDDQSILRENPNGIILGPFAGCGGTTCDGFLTLYKDGELIVQHEYLSRADLFMNSEIINSFRPATRVSVYSDNSVEYKFQWDSLLKIKNTYPTRYHTQPDDKDIIIYYLYK